MKVAPKPSRDFDLLGEAERLERPDSVPVHVYLVPPQAVPGGGGMSMMVVVPTLSKCDQGDQPVIRGIIAGCKAARTPDVCS